MTKRQEEIQGLYKFAEFLTANPDVPFGDPCFGTWAHSKDEMLRLGQGGQWKKEEYGGAFCLYRKFGPGLTYRIFCDRGKVCERKVTGTKWVEGKPATNGHDEEIVEWICPDSLLDGGGGHGSS